MTNVSFLGLLFYIKKKLDFQWVFNHLLKYMGCNLVFILTNEFQAMKQATKYGLCMWHMMEKFLLKVDMVFSIFKVSYALVLNLKWFDYLIFFHN